MPSLPFGDIIGKTMNGLECGTARSSFLFHARKTIMEDTTERLAHLSKAITTNDKKRRKHERILKQLNTNLSRLREELRETIYEEKRQG